MSDVNNYEDETEDTPKDPVRARMRQLEKELKAKEQALVEADVIKREYAFMKAGVPMDSPMSKYFVKGYDGEFTPEAIRLAAEDANLIQKQAQVAQVKSETDAWNRLSKAQRSGDTSEPIVDWNVKINQARSQEEVMQILAQARQETQNI